MPESVYPGNGGAAVSILCYELLLVGVKDSCLSASPFEKIAPGPLYLTSSFLFTVLIFFSPTVPNVRGRSYPLPTTTMSSFIKQIFKTQLAICLFTSTVASIATFTSPSSDSTLTLTVGEPYLIEWENAGSDYSELSLGLLADANGNDLWLLCKQSSS